MAKIYCDGGGPIKPKNHIACGVLILDDNGVEITRFGKYSGIGTNNISEYLAATEAIKWLLYNGYKDDKCIIYMDSMLIVSHFSGRWKCKKDHLKPLLTNLLELAKSFTIPVEFKWVPREENSIADSEATNVLDRL